MIKQIITKKKFEKLIIKNGLEDYKNRLLSICKETIIIKRKDKDNYESIGNTRFGGYPDLPQNTEWPLTKIKDFKGEYQTFYCQINLEDISELQSLLPKKGILYFFLGNDFMENKVIYYSGKIDKLTRRYHTKEMNEYIYKPFKVVFKKSITLPSICDNEYKLIEDIDYEKYYPLYGEIESANWYYLGSMFGYVLNENSIYKESAASIKKLDKGIEILLNIEDDNKIGFYGKILYITSQEKLLKKNFNKIYADLCNS